MTDDPFVQVKSCSCERDRRERVRAAYDAKCALGMKMDPFRDSEPDKAYATIEVRFHAARDPLPLIRLCWFCARALENDKFAKGKVLISPEGVRKTRMKVHHDG